MEPVPREDELVAGPEEASARPRHRPGMLVAVVVAGVALAVVRPGLSLHAEPPDGAQPSPGVSSPSDPGSALGTVVWDTRGNLAQQTSFLGEAVRRIRQDRPEVARVFFAGRLPDGSRLALAGTDVVRGVVATAVHALLVPPGSAVADASVVDLSAMSGSQRLLVWAARGVDGHVYAVLLARPGPVRFQVSGAVRFDALGQASRRWSTVRSGEGLAVVDLGLDVDPVVAIRAAGDGVFPLSEVVPVLRSGPPAAPVVVDGVDDPTYTGPRTELLVRGLQQGAGSLVDLARARPRVLWSGAPWKLRPLALVLLTRPDGVRLQALVGQYGGNAFSAGVRGLPADDPDRTPWLLEPFSAQDPTFLLLPTGAGTVVYRRPPGPAIRLSVGPSGAVGLMEPGPTPPTARGARVVLLDPAGNELFRTTLTRTGVDDPLALSRG